MSFDRMPGPSGSEPAPLAATGGGSDASRQALRMQVLATEHWGLLATRSMVWNEMFARAGMFLTTLTGAVVALALVAQATDFSTGFLIFALAILPVELFVGFASVVRMGKANYYDSLCVIGMNRIRHAYMQLTPEIEPFLVMGTHDDLDSINVSSGSTCPARAFWERRPGFEHVRHEHCHRGGRRRHRGGHRAAPRGLPRPGQLPRVWRGSWPCSVSRAGSPTAISRRGWGTTSRSSRHPAHRTRENHNELGRSDKSRIIESSLA